MRLAIERMLRILRQTGALLASAIALHGVAGAAEPMSETLKLAAEVPIADVHLHLEGKLTPAELLARMDRNNVRWAGGVGPRGPSSELRAAFVAVLGARYIPTLGQPELFVIYVKDGGPQGTEDASHPRLRALVERAEGEFKAGTLKGFGELHANNLTSAPPDWRRKIRADAHSGESSTRTVRIPHGWRWLNRFPTAS